MGYPDGLLKRGAVGRAHAVGGGRELPLGYDAPDDHAVQRRGSAGSVPCLQHRKSGAALTRHVVHAIMSLSLMYAPEDVFTLSVDSCHTTEV